MSGTLFVSASEFLPDDRVRELASCANLDDVHHLTFSVDTSENSLGDLGQRLPSLKQLRLDGSNVTTLRDLGTGLRDLRVLWMARSHLRELEGIGAFGALTELYLAFNEVEDLSPLMGQEQLQVLDLEGNAVADPDQISYLVGCAELHSLTLDGNPVAEVSDYRQHVQQALPQLQYLDDTPTEAAEAAAPAAPPPLPAMLPSPLPAIPTVAASDADARRRELRLIRDGIKYTDALRVYDVQSREALTMGEAPPSHSAGRHGLSSRGSDSSSSSYLPRGKAPCWGGSVTSEATVSTTPGGSSRPLSSTAFSEAHERRPSSSHALASLRSRFMTASASSSRLTTASRPYTSSSSSRGGSYESGAGPPLLGHEDDSSILTFGDDILVCGNPTQALRAKRRNAARAATPVDPPREPPRETLSAESFASFGASMDDGSEAAAAATAAVRRRTATRRGAAAEGGAEDAAAVEFLEALYRFKLSSAIAGAPTDESSGGSEEEGATYSEHDRGDAAFSSRRRTLQSHAAGALGLVADEAEAVDDDNKGDRVLLLDVL
jgi:hypothetical protein